MSDHADRTSVTDARSIATVSRRPPSTTIGERFAARRTKGFDYLRLAMSLIVIFWHSNGIVGPQYGNSSPALWLFARIAVPLFFALSGFLVASSLDRINNVGEFLVARSLRIMPALTIVVVGAAIIIGPLFTTLELHRYLSSPKFAAYFVNLFGGFRVDLPGVFTSLPATGEVNRSLWTIPLEVECYVALAVFYIVGGLRRTPLLFAMLGVLTIVFAWVYRDYSYIDEPSVPGRFVMLYFLAGTIVYRLRHRLLGGPLVGWGLLALSYVMLNSVATTFLSPLVIAYAAAALGCTAPRHIPVVMHGDYSYGLYLYGMPVQQVIVALFGTMPIWIHFPLSVAASGVLAALSWHLVEKRAMALKPRFRRHKADDARQTKQSVVSKVDSDLMPNEPSCELGA